MIEPYLFHSVKWHNFDLLIKILESGYILPRNMLEKGLVTDKNNIFNGTKYISLAQKSLADGGRSSYDELIVDSPCFVLKRDNLDLIYPRYADRDYMSNEEWNKILFQDGDERYSYYEDELQTKNPIPLKSNMIALGIPVDYLKYNYDGVSYDDTLAKVAEALKANNLNVPIINSSRYSFADNKEQIEKNTIHR
jgi:hypothetical protein